MEAVLLEFSSAEMLRRALAIPDRRDPARYSFAHGGKDGHPYPVNKETFEYSIHVLQEAVNKSKIGERDKMYSLKRLGQFAQQRSQV